MNASENNQAEIQPVVEGPGKQLRSIRIAKDLDINRVASLLHLDVALLKSLEADDYSKMQGSVFVQGYLRNYARLLDTPVEPILDAFRAYRPPGQAESDLSVHHLRPEVRSSHTLVRLITWLIVIGLVALVVTWWRGYLEWPMGLEFSPGEPVSEQQTDTMPSLPVDQAGGIQIPGLARGPENLPDDPTPVSEEDLPDGDPADTPPDSLAPLTTNDAPVPSIAAGSAAPDTSSAAGEGTVLPSTAAAEPVNPVPESVPSLAEDEVATAPVTPPAGPVTAGQVQVVFSGACWTDIRDATGTFRLIGNQSAGDQHILGGESPYSMVFGNADAVRILVAGKEYDLAAHTRGNVARFTLDLE